eukprot:763598-Hanusia_phi.AAC.3
MNRRPADNGGGFFDEVRRERRRGGAGGRRYCSIFVERGEEVEGLTKLFQLKGKYGEHGPTMFMMFAQLFEV